ncbi:MAG: ArsB/NhaD family transporter [Thermacetogeniaceae bacterium]
MSEQTQMIAAVVVFVVAYGLIISGRINYALVALGGALLLVLLRVVSQMQALASVDWDTLGLLLGMMMIVGIIGRSGLFQYLAAWSVRLARGEPFLILLLLAAVTALLSAFLNNMTTVLLVAPVTISIAEDLGLTPLPFLFAEIIASNIGGTATLIGDPPNMMIGSAAGLTFTDFLQHLTPVAAIILLATAGCFWLLWGRQLQVSQEQKIGWRQLDPGGHIKDWRLLHLGMLALGLTILGFVLQQALHLNAATIALTGAVLLLLLTGTDPEDAMLSVEWPTMLFFLGLFVMVGALEQTGVIRTVAQQTLGLIGNSPAKAAGGILWLSALASAFFDNIPFTAAMIPIIRDIGALTGIPLQPLWWALALGACLGGNGTLIGASANIAVAGIAERNGYPFTFMQYTRVAFPLMLLSILIAYAYLYFGWLR